MRLTEAYSSDDDRRRRLKYRHNSLTRFPGGQTVLLISVSKIKFRKITCGRPSIDPELLPRMLLVGYLCGVTRLVEKLRMHLAWRWFT